jgi:hypothetical protein
VNKYVVSIFSFDKSETFFRVEPFYFTVFHVKKSSYWLRLSHV